jgi:Zn-dependent protease
VQREIFRRLRIYDERQRRERREDMWELLPECSPPTMAPAVAKGKASAPISPLCWFCDIIGLCFNPDRSVLLPVRWRIRMDPIRIVFYLLALVVSISFHEFAHAWLSNELGDSTARNQGRLTLNPLVHFEPFGALMIVFMAISGWGIGWGKPVPVNPYNLRTDARIGMGLTSAAGPFSNLVLAALFAIPLRLDVAMPLLLEEFVFVLVVVNIGLALFNLIPLPPLDGFGVLQGLLASFGPGGPTSGEPSWSAWRRMALYCSSPSWPWAGSGWPIRWAGCLARR